MALALPRDGGLTPNPAHVSFAGPVDLDAFHIKDGVWSDPLTKASVFVRLGSYLQPENDRPPRKSVHICHVLVLFPVDQQPWKSLAGWMRTAANPFPNGSWIACSGRLLGILYGVAGRLFVAGGIVDFTRVNEYDVTGERPAVLVDLPNYKWDHSTKHWHESAASKDWRFRPFPRHDLLGSKVLGVPWRATPTWQNALRVSALPWLRDHRIGEQVVFSGASYVAMAMEAAYQVAWTTEWSVKGKVPDKYQYRLRDVKFFRALVLEDGPGAGGSKVMTSLAAVPGSNKSPWYEFKVSSLVNDAWTDHASGLVRIETDFRESRAPEDTLAPLRSPVAARCWYKTMSESGFHFGPSFQKHLEIEYTNGQRTSRSSVSLEVPESAWHQSPYVMHPACIDGSFQTVLASVWVGDSSAVDAPLVPLQIDSLTIPWRAEQPRHGVGVANAKYVGIGRTDVPKNYAASTAVYHPVDGSLLIKMKGLRYTELDRSADGDDALAHAYTHVQWQPDPTLLSEASFRQVVARLAADTVANDNTQQ
ncbi:polyketide synthase dehydratase-domain-containing protein [Corynascus novoguineensis]|uniref:Polyketide synthase dehydratase-domain-containing protein n=1 Tax=Corynascus novoguineensis TaxID=1126955 RepID=A0AAN7HFL9_9PEZI|nr:polyketide synthase dehydratase-domain-containing protein [Corynascus novoguineensis]